MPTALANSLALRHVPLSGSSGGASDPVPGYVARWAFDDGSGTSPVEEVSSLDATFVDTPSWIAGNVGDYALEFDGTNDACTVPDDSILDISSTPFSLSLWIYPHVNSGGQGLIHNHGGGPPNGDWEIELASGQVRFLLNGSTEIMRYSSTLTLNQWYHIAVTYDESTYRLYVDAVQRDTDTSASGSPEYGTGGLGIAARFGDRTFFNGAIDDIRIYHKEISASDVSALHDMGAA